jgi:hypothetical protein
METQESRIDTMFSHAEAYGKSTYELLRLKGIERMAVVTSSMLTQVIILALVSMFIIALSIGVALYLGELLEQTYYGFFIVAAFYLLVGLIVGYGLRERIRRAVSNSIIRRTLQ